MELTSKEAVDFPKFPVELLEHYGMLSINIERRGGRYQILYDKQMYGSLRIPQDIAEYMDALKVQYRWDEIIYRVEISRIERQEIINSLRRLKIGKQLGPNGMKAEIYRWMLDSETCLKTLEKCFNCVLCWGSPLKYWRKSRTVIHFYE